MNSVCELQLVEKPGSDGGSPPRKTFIVPPAAAAAVMEPILRPYKMTLDGCIGCFDGEFNRDQEWPWAIIAFPHEYPLAGHVAELRGVKRNLQMSGYTRLSFYLRRLKQPRPAMPVSILVVRRKAILRRLAGVSPFLQPAWAALRLHSEDRHWFHLSEDPPEAWVRENAARDAERFLEAMRSTTSIPHRDPASLKDKARALAYVTAIALMKEKRFLDALPYWQKVVDGGGGDYAEAWFALGLGWREAKDWGKAREAFEQATNLEPRWPEAWHYLSDACVGANRLEEARRACRREIALNPFSESAWFKLGLSCYYLKDDAGALEAFLRSLELEPDHDQEWFMMGDSLYSLERLEEAALAFERSVELNPGHALSWNNLGYCQARLGRAEEALRLCRKSVDLDPRSTHGWDSLGFALTVAGRHREAIPALLKAVELDPQNTEAKEHLIQAYLATGQEDTANRLKAQLEHPVSPGADGGSPAAADGGGQPTREGRAA